MKRNLAGSGSLCLELVSADLELGVVEEPLDVLVVELAQRLSVGRLESAEILQKKKARFDFQITDHQMTHVSFPSMI